MNINVRNLTEFQNRCEASLVRVLKKQNLHLNNRKLDGRNETYIYGEINSLRVWIYSDGSEIAGDNIDERFEKDDFKSEDDLIKAFIDAVESLTKPN